MEDFQACIDYCHLVDSPAVGSLYTWNNKQDPHTRVYSRLDRVLVNSEWLQQKPKSYAHFYNEGLFDHTPCIIQDATSHMTGRRSFKYYNMWSQVPEFHACVNHYWNKAWQGTRMFRVVMKLKSLKYPLKALNKLLFADIENSTAHAWKILDNIQDQLKISPTDPDLILKEKKAAIVYRDLQSACDSFLLQKTKATWINQGDNNTKYFHSILKSKCARNKVFLIEDVNGVAHTDGSKIQSAFLHYYEELLGTTGTVTNVSNVVVQLGPVCSQDHCSVLLSPVTKAEIKEAIFSIPSHKAPGPDGFSSAFFKDA